MIQTASRARFLLEPASAVRIVRKRRREDFDRDVALKVVIARPIDLSHAPGAQRAENFEAAKTITR